MAQSRSGINQNNEDLQHRQLSNTTTTSDSSSSSSSSGGNCTYMPYPIVLRYVGKNMITYQFDYDNYGMLSRLVAVGQITDSITFRKPVLSYFEGDPLIYNYTIQLDSFSGVFYQVALASNSWYCIAYLFKYSNSDELLIFDLKQKNLKLIRDFSRNSQNQLTIQTQRFLRIREITDTSFDPPIEIIVLVQYEPYPGNLQGYNLQKFRGEKEKQDWAFEQNGSQTDDDQPLGFIYGETPDYLYFGCIFNLKGTILRLNSNNGQQEWYATFNNSHSTGNINDLFSSQDLKITNQTTLAHIVAFVYQIKGQQYIGMLEVEEKKLIIGRSYNYQLPYIRLFDETTIIATQIQDTNRVFMLFEAKNFPEFKFILAKADFRFMRLFQQKTLRSQKLIDQTKILAKFLNSPNPSGHFFVITNLDQFSIGRNQPSDQVLINNNVRTVIQTSVENQSCQIMDNMILNDKTIDSQGNFSTSGHGQIDTNIMKVSESKHYFDKVENSIYSFYEIIGLLEDTTTWCFSNQFSISYQNLIQKYEIVNEIATIVLPKVEVNEVCNPGNPISLTNSDPSYVWDPQFISQIEIQILPTSTDTVKVNNPQAPSINFFRRNFSLSTGQNGIQELYVYVQNPTPAGSTTAPPPGPPTPQAGPPTSPVGPTTSPSAPNSTAPPVQPPPPGSLTPQQCLLSFQAQSISRPIPLTYQLNDDPLFEDISIFFPTPSPQCTPEIQIEADPIGSFDISSIIKRTDFTLEIATSKFYMFPLQFKVTGTYMKNDPKVMQTKYQVYKLTILNPEVIQQSSNTSNRNESIIVANQKQMSGKEDQIGEVKIEDIIVTAEENSVHEFDKNIFRAKNIVGTIKLTKSHSFASYANGELQLRPKISDIGNYTEFAKIVQKNQPPIMVQFNIIVKENLKKNCPVGKLLADCYPKIQKIDTAGLMTVLFPISIKIINQTIYDALESDIQIVFQKTQQTNSSLNGWKIQSLSEKEIKIQLNISDPLYVSLDQNDKDQIRLVFLNTSRITMTNQDFQIQSNYSLLSPIPQLTLNTTLMRTVQKTFGLIDSSMTSGVIVNLILAIVIRAPMKQMWFMINSLQILTFMPSLNIQIPSNLRVCLVTIKEVANLSLIPQSLTDSIVKWIGGIQESTESLGTIALIGIVGVALAAGTITIGLLYFLSKRFPQIYNLYVSLRDKLIFGAILTFYLKSYLKLFTNSFEGYFDETKSLDSRLLPYVILLILAVSPAILFVGLLVSPLNSEVYERRFGSLTQFLAPRGFLFNFFFIFRRFIYGLSISLLPSSPGFQIIIQLAMSLMHILYMIKVWPYTLMIDNIFEMFNEASTLVVLTFSIHYADNPFTPEVSTSLGFGLIGVIVFNIAINMGYFFVEQVKFVWVKLKEVKCIKDRLNGGGVPSTVPIAPEIPKENKGDKPEEEPTQSYDNSVYDLQTAENMVSKAQEREAGVVKINSQNISEMINDDEIWDDYKYSDGNADYEEVKEPQKNEEAKDEDSFRFSDFE